MRIFLDKKKFIESPLRCQNESRACNLTSFSPCLTGPVDYLFASRHKGPRFKSPWGYLCETGILLLTLSHYIGDPDVIDCHGLIWGGLHPEPSLGPHTDDVIILLDLTQLFCPGFTLATGLPSGFTTTELAAGGGALRKACNLTSFSLCLTGPVDYLFASRHKGPRFKSPGGYDSIYININVETKNMFTESHCLLASQE
jgi:hypothetical protein